MRKTSLDMVYTLAKKDERVFFIGSDLGVGTLDDFKKTIPGRFFMEGVSEQNLVGVAAGLALEGKIPYVNTIATFLTRRCFEQNVLDAGLHNLPIRLLANGGGLVYAPLGPTHLAIDDIAIMRSIPNMTVIAPADATEMTRVMEASLPWPGPIYIRFGKGGDPIVTRPEDGYTIGKAILRREGDAALVVTTGITLKTALDAAELIKADGLEIAILHCHTVKPLDAEAILKHAARVPAVLTIEEHTLIGGLGSAVAELLLDNGVHKRFKRIGIPDVFPKKYGSQASQMKDFGITAEALAASVKALSSKVPA